MLDFQLLIVQFLLFNFTNLKRGEKEKPFNDQLINKSCKLHYIGNGIKHKKKDCIFIIYIYIKLILFLWIDIDFNQKLF